MASSTISANNYTPIIGNNWTYHSVESNWKDSRIYTCPVDAYYLLGVRGNGTGNITPRWGINGDSWFYASQNTNMEYTLFYFRAGTKLWTRDMSSLSYSTYDVKGYWIEQ